MCDRSWDESESESQSQSENPPQKTFSLATSEEIWTSDQE